MALRALAVLTKLSQDGFGWTSLAVMILIFAPLCSGSEREANCPLTLQAMQLLPTSVCTA